MTKQIDNHDKPPSWFSQLFKKKPETEDETIEAFMNVVHKAHHAGLVATDAMKMIEGVIRVDHFQARDIMLPRSQINFIDPEDNFHDILQRVLASGHSRYPVIAENNESATQGILHTKDLLKYIGREDEFHMEDILRETIYATESQRLDTLLAKFKSTRRHMAVIIDEYGKISGLITIEDILEQIVGDIVDEHDRIVQQQIIDPADGTFMVQAMTPIEDVNEYFSLNLDTDQFDTIGGLVSHTIGRIPKVGEITVMGAYEFEVLESDGRRILLLKATPIIRSQESKQVA